jgi:hypothetical protein
MEVAHRWPPLALAEREAPPLRWLALSVDPRLLAPVAAVLSRLTPDCRPLQLLNVFGNLIVALAKQRLKV